MTPSGMLPPRPTRPAAEADRARAAEAEVRGELDRVRADARQAVTQALDGAAREREELRAWAGQQAEAMRAELAQARADASRLVERTSGTTRRASPGPAVPARHGAAGRGACAGTGRPSGTG